jgi:hypothetical protein
MSIAFLKKEFLSRYLAVGPDKFYRELLTYCIKKIMEAQKEKKENLTVNLELLDYYDQLIILYRREGDSNYLDLAKLIRKAAHKIYRVMLKQNLTNKNNRFLNLV